MSFVIPFVILLSLLLVACGGGGDSSDAVKEDAAEPVAEATTEARSEEDALNKPDPVGAYGEPIATQEMVTIAGVLSQPEALEGSRVLVMGTVNEVCPKRGCWIELADGEDKIRVKVVDGDIVFPLSAKGHEARVEGIVEKIELDEEAARGWMEHEAEEKGEEFDPASVTGPMVIWRIQGKGAEISE